MSAHTHSETVIARGLCRRRTFDASLPPPLLYLELKSVDALYAPSVLEQFSRVMSTFGAVVLRLGRVDAACSTLLSLAPLLGEVWRHRRSDAQGIARIQPTGEYPGYLGTSPDEHPPHTDGAYHSRPPRFVCMLCEVPSRHGGESVLVSGKLLFRLASARYPEGVRALSRGGSVTIGRADESVATSAFVNRGDSVGIIFRSDQVSSVQVCAEGVETYAYLSALCRDPEYRLVFRLERNDLLIVDNFAVLHGRTRIERGEDRLLYRLDWATTPHRENIFPFGFRGDPEWFSNPAL